MTDIGEGTAARRFPALDPEPPPGPWWRRLAIPAAGLVVAASVVAGVRLWPSSSGAPARLAVTLPGGRVLAVAPAGGLALSAPGGGPVRSFRRLGTVGLLVAISPGNRYLALFNGQVIMVGRGPVLATAPTKVPLSSETSIAWPEPFADHARALVMLRNYGVTGSASPVFVVSLATGHQVPLGRGEQVAGDPQADGAFVSVPAPAKASASLAKASPDSRIELRDARRAPVVVATAGRLNRVLGEPPSTAAALAAFPAPSGAEVAVTVEPTTQDTAAGIVVMSRSGRVLSRVRAAGVQRIPVWSPSGRSLAYLGTGRGAGPGLQVWTPGSLPTTSRLPAAGGPYSTCIWSPDGRWVLCAGTGGRRWAVSRARGGHATLVPGAGVPVAWLR